MLIIVGFKVGFFVKGFAVGFAVGFKVGFFVKGFAVGFAVGFFEAGFLVVGLKVVGFLVVGLKVVGLATDGPVGVGVRHVSTEQKGPSVEVGVDWLLHPKDTKMSVFAMDGILSFHGHKFWLNADAP